MTSPDHAPLLDETAVPAAAAVIDLPAHDPAETGLPPGLARLSDLMAAHAARHPERLALLDQPGREDWSGRPRIAWTYATAEEVRRRLAAYFAGLGLAPGAPVGIHLAGGSEACLSLLALEEAGLTPCLLPLAGSEAELGAAVEAAGIQAIVTQGAVGETRPAEAVCRLAAGYFGLRFVCAFGPLVPDGVVDLDRVILAESGGSDPLPAAAAEAGLVTFLRRPGPPVACHRGVRALVASAAIVLAASRVEPGDRILSLLAPDDLRGLATGLVLCLLSGAALEHHGLFEGGRLAESAAQAMPTHLVAPGWMEPHLARAGLPPSVRTIVLVHEPPVRFRARMPLARPVVDILALDETALVPAARRGAQVALSLGEAGPASHWLRLRLDDEGVIEAAGLATDVRSYARGQVGPRSASEWVSTGRRAELFSGLVIGVT